MGVKTETLVKQVVKIEVTITRTETEALLLENNLIKQYKPKYNILLRDDKSYPYIIVSTSHPYPRIDLYRGKKIGSKKDRYFGPYPSVAAVRETLNIVQKVFKIRSCADPFFNLRRRPCLQYPMQRCTAPCVDFISDANYQKSVQEALAFLEGKNKEVIENLEHQMFEASRSLDFERAALLREQIKSVRKIQEEQHITHIRGEVDVIAFVEKEGIVCIQWLSIRHGHLLGSKTFFPQLPKEYEAYEIMEAFVSQYYLLPDNSTLIPPCIMMIPNLPVSSALTEALSQRRGKKCVLQHPMKGKKFKWLEMAENNARTSLEARLVSRTTLSQRFEALQTLLGLPSRMMRLECFDISHLRGESPVGACVVFNDQGALKSEYRCFNIKNITPGDDYAAIRQAVDRHYRYLKTHEGIFPEVLLIDGGKGQVRQALEVLETLQIQGVLVIGVAKGPSRKPGLETLILSHIDQEISLPTDAPALHLIQQIRDEAHRFAVFGHRRLRDKKKRTSLLEQIPGIGPNRRRALYLRLGGWQEVCKASIEALAKTPGMSVALAKRVYDALHESNI